MTGEGRTSAVGARAVVTGTTCDRYAAAAARDGAPLPRFP